MGDIYENAKDNYPDLDRAAPEELTEWLGTLAQVHKSKAVHADCTNKIYTQSDMELEKAHVFENVINFLSKHLIYTLQTYDDSPTLEIIEEFENLVFNKHELEDIIFMQPISDTMTAQKLHDLAENMNTLRDKGMFDNKTVMIIDSSIRIIHAKLGVSVESSEEI